MQCDICLDDFPQLDMYCARGSQRKLTVKEARDGCGHFSCLACMQVCMLHDSHMSVTFP